MADIIDDAQVIADTFLKSALTTKKPEGPLACGYCCNCVLAVPNGLRFCDADCRDDYEIDQRLSNKA